jgi:hypothetical protein
MQYHKEFYNKVVGDEQRLRLGEGCPNRCKYCYSDPELISYNIPEIERNSVSIMDMNFLYNPKHKERIIELGRRRVGGKVVFYELICGIDWRLIDQETANLLKENRFVNIRFAWDYGLELQYKIKDCYDKLRKAGYNSKELMCFILCDWEIPFEECLLKLDTLKVWNVKVADSYFDNVVPPNYQLNYWTMQECKLFRSLCAIHNHLITFGLYADPQRAKRACRLINKQKEQTILRFG